jgi:thiol-disulfide isomerase/thioredoxin
MLFNQYSFLILSGMAVAALLIWAGLGGFRTDRLLAAGALALGCTLAFLLFAPRATPPAESGDAATRIGGGRPVLLEFQSPYCLACMAARPVVDRLEKQLAPHLTVIRLNLQDPSSAPLARLHGVQYTPTFLLFDGQGGVLLRSVGAIDPAAVERLLSGTG